MLPTKPTVRQREMRQTKMANKKLPMRQCVGCGEMKDKREMIRVIKTAENEIILDNTGKKNGRGAYLCADSGCLEQARKSKGLERSLKMAIPQEIYEQLAKEMSGLEK